MRRSLQTRYGFSLAEVMIAILVIVIGLAGVTASLVYGVKNSKRGREVSESSQISRAVFEYMQNTNLIDMADLDRPTEWPDEDSGINDKEEERRLLNDPPFGGVYFRPEYVAQYRRNIKIERVSNDITSHRHKLARVTVRIYWSEGPIEHHSELIGMIRHERRL